MAWRGTTRRGPCTWAARSTYSRRSPAGSSLGFAAMLRRAHPFVASVGEELVFPHRQPLLDGVHKLRTGTECGLAMGGGDRHDQGGLADVHHADPVAARNRTHSNRFGGDVGHHLGDDI